MRNKRKQMYLMCLNNAVNILCFMTIIIATVALIIFYSDACKLITKVTQNNTYVVLPISTFQKIKEENDQVQATLSPNKATEKAVADVTTTNKRHQYTKPSHNDVNDGDVQKEQITPQFIQTKEEPITAPVVKTTISVNTVPSSTQKVIITTSACKTPPVLPPKDDVAKCGSRKADMKCCEYIWAMNYKDDILKRLKCISRVSQGSNGSPADFPHMVAVGWFLKEKNNCEFRCSGSLISSKFVLTSAHCINSDDVRTERRVVRLGIENIHETNDNEGQDIEIEEWISHPTYDLALLKLKRTVIFTNKIHPACISTSLSTARFTKVNVTGWEVTNSDTRTKEISGRLQKSILNMIRRQACLTELKKNQAINESWESLQMHQLCAIVDGSGNSWQGESGSPIQVKINTKSGYMHSVIGVTSISHKGSTDIPGIYISVSSVLTWIEENVWPEDEEDEFTKMFAAGVGKQLSEL